MDLARIETAVRKERQKSELNPLDESFYKDVNDFLQVLYKERERAAEKAEDPFSSHEVKKITDEIETVEETVESLYERRSGKIVKAASFASAGMVKEIKGATSEEKKLFNDLVDELNNGRERVLDTINNTNQSPETGNNDSKVDSTSKHDPVPSQNSSEPVNIINEQQNENTVSESNDGLDPSAVMGPASESGQTGFSSNTTDTPEPERERETKTETGPNTESVSSTANSLANSSDDSVERTTVRVTQEVGEIVGTDDREYYLHEQDVVTLPEQNANILVDKGAAVTVD